MPPELFIARHRHSLMLAGPLAYRYDDPKLEAWVQRVNYLIDTPGEVERCRKEHRTLLEQATIEREIRRMGEEDYEY